MQYKVYGIFQQKLCYSAYNQAVEQFPSAIQVKTHFQTKKKKINIFAYTIKKTHKNIRRKTNNYKEPLNIKKIRISKTVILSKITFHRRLAHLLHVPVTKIE